MVNRVSKVSPERWLDAARKILIEEGVDHVKIDRLATSLRVTRGGFYHHFHNRDELLDKLLVQWEETNTFIPDLPPPKTRRWVARRKAEVVAAVRGGLLSLEEACERYKLTVDEFLSWQRSIDKHGLAGLRATRIQDYRS